MVQIYRRVYKVAISRTCDQNTRITHALDFIKLATLHTHHTGAQSVIVARK